MTRLKKWEMEEYTKERDLVLYVIVAIFGLPAVITYIASADYGMASTYMGYIIAFGIYHFTGMKGDLQISLRELHGRTIMLVFSLIFVLILLARTFYSISG